MNSNDDGFYLFSDVVIKESQIQNNVQSNKALYTPDLETLSDNPLIKSNDMKNSLIVQSKDCIKNMDEKNNSGDVNKSKNIENDKILSENSKTLSKKNKNKPKKRKKQINNDLGKNDEEEISDTNTKQIDSSDLEKKKRKLPSDSIESTETNNLKKKRKKNKKKKNNQNIKEEKEEDTSKIDEYNQSEENIEENKNENSSKLKKQNIKIIKNNRQISFFVGQIPYDCKEDQIRKHFEKNGIEVKDIRMLYKDDGSFKGCCFLHVPATQKEKTAKLHHSFLNNRQINVTLDPKSLGLTSKTSKDIMKTTIKKIRNDADKTTEEVMAETLQNIMNKAKGSVTPNDIDKKSLTALCSLPNNLSERLINDFSRLNFAGVKNINAYLMGMIKKYRTKYIPISKK